MLSRKQITADEYRLEDWVTCNHVSWGFEVPDLEFLSASQFTVSGCQASIFTPDYELATNFIMKHLMVEWSDIFDAEPTILPSMPGLPREVPRITLQNQSRSRRCELSSGRLNFFLMRTAAEEGGSLDYSAFYLDTIVLLKKYCEITEARVGRLAAIQQRFSPHDQPGMCLSRHFCDSRWFTAPLNRPQHFELHAHKAFAYGPAGEFTVNSWVRNRTATVSTSTEKFEAVAIEQDINTLAEAASDKAFNLEEIDLFFSCIADEFDYILNLYYPEDEDQK